jgi:Zn-dependent M32 family carboxypeptidase
MSSVLDVLLAMQNLYGQLFDEARERGDFDEMMEYLEQLRILSRKIADLVDPR